MPNIAAGSAIVSSEAEQPFWSVMIPTYEPASAQLEAALRAVLRELGSSDAQITVVDDCSPTVDVGLLVQSIGGDRVHFSKTPRNLGLAGNWNTCIERARGRWVHILHQDDLVFEGFYAQLRALIDAQPALGAAFTRHCYIDEAGKVFAESTLERESAGVLENWLERLASWQRIECAAIVVRRACYASLGGFRAELSYVLDWEMWARIAAAWPVGYVPRTLAAYRQHANSATARLTRERRTLGEIRRGATLIEAMLPIARRRHARATFRQAYAAHVCNQAVTLYVHRQPKAARELLRENSSYFPRSRRPAALLFRAKCVIKEIRESLARAMSPHDSSLTVP